MKFTSGKYTSGELLDNVRSVEDWITNQYDIHGQITDPVLQRDMSNRMLDVSFGRNDCFFDDMDYPSIMVRMPETRVGELDPAWGNNLHPAFVVNNQAVQVWIAKYIVSTVGSGSERRALSLRRKDPAAGMNWDTAYTVSAQKGPGWHLITAAEWGLILNICRANGFWPRGNNSYGREYSRLSEHGEVSYQYLSNDIWYNGRTATGTGPVSWSHDGSPFGIFDLNGNVLEWIAGWRLLDGEIQIFVNNNAADNTKDVSAESPEWRAILEDGSIVEPGTAGTLKFDATNADGSGNIVLSTTSVNKSDGTTSANTRYRDLTTVGGVTAPDILHQLGIFPKDSNYGLGQMYMRNVGERMPNRGGGWSSASNAGVPYADLYDFRSNSYRSLGFRFACIK